MNRCAESPRRDRKLAPRWTCLAEFFLLENTFFYSPDEERNIAVPSDDSFSNAHHGATFNQALMAWTEEQIIRILTNPFYCRNIDARLMASTNR